MKKRSTPEQRVGRAANVTIFLGILFTLVHLLALSGLPAMAPTRLWASRPGYRSGISRLGLRHPLRQLRRLLPRHRRLCRPRCLLCGARCNNRRACDAPALRRHGVGGCKSLPRRPGHANPTPKRRVSLAHEPVRGLFPAALGQRRENTRLSLLQNVGCKGEPDSCKNARKRTSW